MADGLLFGKVAYERDTTVFYYPLMRWVDQRLHAGELPLWTPQVFGGYPIFADGEIGLSYPPTLLALWLLPTDAALIGLRLVHLCLAGLGTYAFVRAWRLPRPSAAIAGLVFALGNFLSAQIQHENIIRTGGWLPVILTCAEYALRARTSSGRWRWTLAGAVALGMAGLGLHSQMLAIDLLIVALYSGMRLAVGPHAPRVAGLSRRAGALAHIARVSGPIVVIGMALAAVQVVPLLELARFSPRGSGLAYSDAAAYSLTPYGLAQLIFPYVFRGPNNVQWGLWTHWESYLYVGLAPLVLAIVALVFIRTREVWAWAAFGALGIVLALGQYSVVNVHYLLWLVPGMSGLRAPGRFTVLTVLAAAMLGAYGLAWLIELAQAESARDRERVQRLIRRLGIGLACLTGLLVLAHVALNLWSDQARAVVDAIYLRLPRDSYTLTTTTVLQGLLWWTNLLNVRTTGALLGLAAILVCIWMWARGSATAGRRSAQRWAPAALVAATAVDLLIFTVAIHPHESLSMLGGEPHAVRAIEGSPSLDGAPNRILASPVLNQVSADRLAPFVNLQEANGYSSLQFMWHRDYLNRVLYVDDALLDLWNIRYLIEPARFGTLQTYKGVSYLSQQALSHAPAGSDLGEQRFALAPGSHVSELRFITALMGAVGVQQGTPVARFELLDAGGNSVGSAELQAGRDSMDWASAIPALHDRVQHQQVEAAGTTYEGRQSPQTARQLSFADVVLDQPVGATTLMLRTLIPQGEFVLYGGAIINSDGSTQQLFGRTKTRYREVFADDEMRVLENVSAQPRALVVPRARMASSVGAALSDMVHTRFAPDREVILADDGSGVRATYQAAMSDGGGDGTATITGYSAQQVEVRATASADAWLLLSDTFYPGWSATLDGQPTPVLRGDVLFRVVRIPAGTHTVVFTFTPTSTRAGLAISVAALLVVLVSGVVLMMMRRQRQDRLVQR